MDAVVHIEVTGIQDFIFRSRTLIDTIGRSYQIEQLTAPGQLPTGTSPAITPLFAAAGRVSVRVPHASAKAPNAAHDFAALFTRRLAEISDALTPVVHIDYCETEDQVAHAVVNAPRALQLARHRTMPSLAGDTPWAALDCPVTGAGAEGVDRDGQPCAGEIAASAVAGAEFHQRQTVELLAGVAEPLRSMLSLPRQSDQLGRTHGESSHVAVIVADLNGMGSLLRELADGPDPADTLTRASAALRALGSALGAHLVATVARSLQRDENGEPMVGGFPERTQFTLARSDDDVEPVWMLPLRPWVLAGDDIVLVCESRIAWSVATEIMAWLDEPVRADDDPRAVLETLFGMRPTIGIGVSVVPSGYPLIRAHELAERLCRSAKDAAREKNPDTPSVHAVNWHRGPGDPDSILPNRVLLGARDPRPFTHTRATPDSSLRAFLDTWLGPHENSLNGSQFSLHRGWTHGVLRDAATGTDNGSPAAIAQALDSLNNAREVAGHSALALPPQSSPGKVLAAIDLLDGHLALIVADTPATVWEAIARC
ncbi:hypothetical protein ACGFIX_14435 [Nocardia salmonicida]|uniref:hypothetical protein n=1 Tax=Nocardia salmonicida TaxID=53431 RepID=UPI003717DD9A